MPLLLTDVFLLLTQLILWLIVGTVIWFFLSKVLKKEFLGLLVLILLLAVIVLAFFRGGINEPGSVLEIIWRVISFPLSPFGLGLIFLILLLAGVKLSQVARRLILGGLILLALGSIPLVANFLAQELEFEAIELVAPAPVPATGTRQVIVLLGQNTTRPFLRPRVNPPPAEPQRVERAIKAEQYDILSNLPTQITEHGDRILYAADLYRQGNQNGVAPLIAVSGGVRPNRLPREGEKREDVSEARDIQLLLTRMFNVPEGNILLDHDNGTIRRSAETVKKLLDDQQINYGDQITLVASGLNMNRAALTFREVFRESRIIVRPTDFYTLPPEKNLSAITEGRDRVRYDVQITDILPTADAFCLSSKAIQEYLNAFYYFIRGWIKPFQAPNVSTPAT